MMKLNLKGKLINKGARLKDNFKIAKEATLKPTTGKDLTLNRKDSSICNHYKAT
jgi:hypothetical protein